MKIAIFSNCYRPMINGVVGVVSLLRKGFLEQGHEVYLFVPAYEDYVDDEAKIYRYRSVNLINSVKYPVAIPFSPRIQKVIDSVDFDIVHCHHPFVLGPLGRKTARRKHIPIVYTFHTQYEQYSHYIPLPSRLVNAYSRHQIIGFCESVDAVTTPSDSAKQLLTEYGVKNSVTVIPNPTQVTSGADGSAVRERYGLTDEKLLINVGRVGEEKNLGLLLESFALMLKQSQVKLRLMIVGDGPVLQQLKDQAQSLQIADKVIFTGAISPELVAEHLAAATVFVMTSKSEVKPLSQLEALAAGLPIVAVAAAGANDTIVSGQNGYLVSEDAAEFTARVLELTEDEAKLQRFKAAAKLSVLHLDYTNIAATTLKWYSDVIDRNQQKKARKF